MAGSRVAALFMTWFTDVYNIISWWLWLFPDGYDIISWGLISTLAYTQILSVLLSVSYEKHMDKQAEQLDRTHQMQLRKVK